MTLKSGLGVVQGHWKWCRSIDHMTFYWSVVTTALSCINFELFYIQNIVTLKSRFGIAANGNIQ